MNIKGYRIISEKNVFRRIAALLTTLLLVITVIPEGFSTAITSVAEAADTAWKSSLITWLMTSVQTTQETP